MKNYTKIGSLIVIIMLSGCASYSGVVPMGEDTYLISKQQATGFPGLGKMKADLITTGVSYCKDKGKHFQIVSIQETQPPYILGNYPREEIHFMCLSTGDIELQRPKVKPAPNAVIEIKQ